MSGRGRANRCFICMYICSADAPCAGRRDRMGFERSGMFQTLASPKKRPAISITGSLLLQLVLVFVFLYHPPIFVKPSSLASGQKGRSEALVYLAQARVEPA